MFNHPVCLIVAIFAIIGWNIILIIIIIRHDNRLDFLKDLIDDKANKVLNCVNRTFIKAGIGEKSIYSKGIVVTSIDKMVSCVGDELKLIKKYLKIEKKTTPEKKEMVKIKKKTKK